MEKIAEQLVGQVSRLMVREIYGCMLPYNAAHDRDPLDHCWHNDDIETRCCIHGEVAE